MNQFTQANSNDLQKAIDEISGGAEAPEGAVAPAEPSAENVQVNLGEPPVPPTDGAAMPPLPEMGETPAPVVEETTVVAEEPVAPAEPVAAPTFDAPAADASTSAPVGEVDDVKKSALMELAPIIDSVSLEPKEKYEYLMTVIEAGGDRSFAPKALEAAKAISDTQEKAEALLRIVKL